MENRWWNSRKIDWYERASRFCDFQSLLTKEIESFITKDESIVEFGCGLGYISENLYNHGYDVTAYDIDQEVIERAKKRSGLDIYHTEDYKESNIKRDVVLTVFFGRLWLHDNLSSLLSHGRKRLVSIHSLHIGQNDSLKARYTPTLEESISLLEEKGMKARGREISISFPQPLESMEEAKIFIEESYPGKDISLYLPYIIKSDDSSFPYTFSNEKKMVILDIQK